MSVTASRRTPVQGRSQVTVRKVRDAAAVLLARGHGVEMLTTAQIAAIAGVSVGALYRFFPDKQAIVDAIALDHMAAFEEALMARLMLAFPADAPAFLAAVVDGFVAYLDQHPDFRTLAFGQGTRTISAATRDSYAASGEMLGTLREVLAETYGVVTDDRFDLRLRLAIEAGERLLAFALEQPAREAALAEVRRILVAILFGA